MCACSAHGVCTVIVTGMLKVAPWHPLTEADVIEAAPGSRTKVVVEAGIAMERPVWFVKLTPELVAVHPLPPVTVIAPPVATTLTRWTWKVFGLWTLTMTSPVDPGRSEVLGVSLVMAATVTICIVPVLPAPVPEPWLVK